MRNHSSRKTLISKRRSVISDLRLKGYSQRAIMRELPNLGFINDGTGMPYSLALVNKDIQAVEKEWREERADDISAHKARQVEELALIKVAAWSKNKLRYVLDALAQEVAILGTNAPVVTESLVKIKDDAAHELNDLIAGLQEDATTERKE